MTSYACTCKPFFSRILELEALVEEGKRWREREKEAGDRALAELREQMNIALDGSSEAVSKAERVMAECIAEKEATVEEAKKAIAEAKREANESIADAFRASQDQSEAMNLES